MVSFTNLPIVAPIDKETWLSLCMPLKLSQAQRFG
jgi:hypothetical protein